MKKKKSRRKKKIFGTSERPRLVVHRTLRGIYGQIVDDSRRQTIVGGGSKSKDIQEAVKKAGSKTEVSKLVGEMLARKAKEKKISKVVFDRNGYKYHGRVKALADGARQGGLEF